MLLILFGSHSGTVMKGNGIKSLGEPYVFGVFTVVVESLAEVETEGFNCLFKQAVSAGI